jgi:DNA invertase Pin-like site-specific DNA recombinase
MKALGPGPRRAISRELLERFLDARAAADRRAAEEQARAVQPPRLVGYARVSTDEQTTALQLDALRRAGCVVIYEDSASGALRSRPGLDQALADLGPGDTLVIWKLDRVGRSLSHLLEVADTLRKRGIALRSLTEHLDTGTPAGTLLYSVLGAVAEFERDIIRERTRGGMAAAKSRGVRLGAPKRRFTPGQIEEAKRLFARGDSVNSVARALGASKARLWGAMPEIDPLRTRARKSGELDRESPAIASPAPAPVAPLPAQSEAEAHKARQRHRWQQILQEARLDADDSSLDRVVQTMATLGYALAREVTAQETSS